MSSLPKVIIEEKKMQMTELLSKRTQEKEVVNISTQLLKAVNLGQSLRYKLKAKNLRGLKGIWFSKNEIQL